VFGTFCLADEKAARYVPEKVYDNLTSRVVQVTSKIVNIVKDMRPGGLQDQVLRDVANVLRLGEKDAFEQLEKIESRLLLTGVGDNKTLSYISSEELAARNLKAAAEDSNGELHRIVRQVGIPAVTALLLSKAQNTSDPETARSLWQMAVQIRSKLAGNVTEGDWTKPDENGKSVRATVPRFPPRQLQEWENEVCERDITEMSEEDKRTEYCSALDRLKEIEKATERETIEQWVSEKGIPVRSATSPQTSGTIPLLKTAGGIIAVEPPRLAEIQVLKWLLNGGWQVKDVSGQNMGYDIGGRDSKGKDAFVEVKSIKYRGASFSLTSNEYAVAHEKGPSYYVALVPPQTCTHFEVVFIRDPAKLKPSQKCQKWVWEFATSPLD
jgi:hypothetical protein